MFDLGESEKVTLRGVGLNLVFKKGPNLIWFRTMTDAIGPLREANIDLRRVQQEFIQLYMTGELLQLNKHLGIRKYCIMRVQYTCRMVT